MAATAQHKRSARKQLALKRKGKPPAPILGPGQKRAVLMKVALSMVLALSLMPGMAPGHTEKAHAATTSFTVKRSNDLFYPVNGTAKYSAVIDGQEYVVYCNDPHASDSPKGTYDISRCTRGTNRQNYLLAKGYPNSTTIAGTNFNANDAQAATQIAMWMDGDPDLSYEFVSHLSTEYNQPAPARSLYDTAKQFFSEANGYQGGDASIDNASATYVSDQAGAQRIITLSIIRTGGLELAKATAAAALSDNNENYTLEGAVFEVRDAAGALAATLTTDEDGKASAGDLPAGNYTVSETKPPAGFALPGKASERRKTVAVTAGETIAAKDLTFLDTPQSALADIRVQKVDATTGASVPQGNASLAGAQFTFNYYAVDPSSVKKSGEGLPNKPTRSWVMQTDGQGYASLAAGRDMRVSGDSFYRNEAGDIVLPLGVLTIRETAQPDGYRLKGAQNTDPTLFIVRIQKNETDETSETAEVKILNESAQGNTLENPDEVKRGNIAIDKDDADMPGGAAQGDATLKGTVFEIENASANSVVSPQTGKEVAPGGIVCTIVSDANGAASTRSSELNGWSIPADWNDKALAYGTYIIRESAPPNGYRLNEGWSETVEITENSTKAISYTMADPVQRGNLALRKYDSATRNGAKQGGAVLAGAMFEVTNASAKPVVSPQTGAAVAPGGVVCTIVSDENGYASTDRSDLNGWAIPSDWEGKALAYGTYTVRETAPPDGYLINATWTETFEVRADSQLRTYELSDVVKRGDFGFNKVEGTGMKALAGIPFLITSQSTGEAHVAVTDENGMLSTASSWNAHSHKTNANDAAISSGSEAGSGAGGTYKVDEKKLDASAGIWFDGHGDSSTGAPVDDTLGALPYDTYTVQELPVSRNKDLNLVSFQVTITRHGRELDRGTVDDNAAPNMATQLADMQGNRLAPEGVVYTLVDTISYENLDPGTYTFEGALHLYSADGTYEGVVAQANTQASVNAGTGSAQVVFEVDTTGMGGKKLVAFERCYSASGDLVAAHEDPEDEGQSIRVPEIRTTLTDARDGDHEVATLEPVTLVDTVAYSGLQPYKTYEMTMTAHVKAEDGSDAGIALDAFGQEVTATTTFTPTEPDGTVEVSVTFTPAAGCIIVAFEELKTIGQTYAVHADISDENQSVNVVTIGTTARDGETGSHVGRAREQAQVIDTVSYAGVQAGAAYVMAGTLIDAETGEAIAQAETPFVPEATQGSVEIPFDLDASGMAGRSVVVFERLYREGAEEPLASHEDTSDRGQTVDFSDLGTSAQSGGNHAAAASEELTIVDTVRYAKVEPGQTYRVVGTLMDKATGKPLEANGKPIVAEATFVAEAAEGTVEVAFTFDATSLGGTTTVAFEKLYDANGNLIAEHEDIEDEEQTVWIARIGTTAIDGKTKTHEGTAAKKTVIIDTVAFEGLEPGGRYSVTGTLYDKATGKPFEAADGTNPTATKTFTARSSSG
ncbi:MAG TPA: hypothetical protein DCP91_08055, partial [Eggerthellaceae bacterium]|nr:hypothetical protein [Eggerthellaceae bacterium]